MVEDIYKYRIEMVNYTNFNMWITVQLNKVLMLRVL